MRKTNPVTIAKIDKLLHHHTDDKVAELLNKQGITPAESSIFTKLHICRLRYAYKLKSHFDHLRDAGMLKLEEVCEKLNISRSTALIWRKKGYLKAHVYDGNGRYLYEPLDYPLPEKNAHRKSEKIRS